MYYSIDLFKTIYMQRYKYYRISANNSIYIYGKSINFDLYQYLHIPLYSKYSQYFYICIRIYIITLLSFLRPN